MIETMEIATIDTRTIEHIPHVGNMARILKHGLCDHIGQVGEIINVRRNQQNQITAIQVSFPHRYNPRSYWLPVLRDEVKTGDFKYFELLPF